MTLHATQRDNFWLYAPASPTPATAPVIVYLKGYGDSGPDYYDALFTHLARKGYMVVYPSYGHPFYDLYRFESIALRSVRDALRMLQTHDAPRPSGQLALGGFSLGGLLALRIAAQAEAAGIPDPDLLLLHDPAGVAILSYPLSASDLAGIPSTTRMLVIQAEASVGDANSFAEGAFLNTVSIPRAQKNLLMVSSDNYGNPQLVSDHLSVQSGGWGRPLNAIDFWGYFRPTEAALLEVFASPAATLAVSLAVEPEYSAFCSSSGIECEAVRFAGEWSDGTPVESHQNAGDRGL